MDPQLAPGATKAAHHIAVRLLSTDELLQLPLSQLEDLHSVVSDGARLKYEGTRNLVPPSVHAQYVKRIGKALEVLRAPELDDYTYDQLFAMPYADLAALQAQLSVPTPRFRCTSQPCLWRCHQLKSLRTRVDHTVRLYHAHCVEWKSTEDLLAHSSKAELEEVESLLTKPGLVFYVRGELCPRELSSTEVASLLRRVQRACWLCVNCDVYDYRILDRLDYTMEELKNMSHCTLFRLRVAARARCCIPKDCFDEKRSHMDFPWTRWAAEHKTLRHNVQMVIDAKYPNLTYRNAVCLMC